MKGTHRGFSLNHIPLVLFATLSILHTEGNLAVASNVLSSRVIEKFPWVSIPIVVVHSTLLVGEAEPTSAHVRALVG